MMSPGTFKINKKAPVACNRRAKCPCSIGISRGIIDNYSSQHQLEFGTEVIHQYDCDKKQKRERKGGAGD